MNTRARHGVLEFAPSRERRPRRKDRLACAALTRAGGRCRVWVEPGRRAAVSREGLSAGPETREGGSRIAEAQRRPWSTYRERRQDELDTTPGRCCRSLCARRLRPVPTSYVPLWISKGSRCGYINGGTSRTTVRHRWLAVCGNPTPLTDVSSKTTPTHDKKAEMAPNPP